MPWYATSPESHGYIHQNRLESPYQKSPSAKFLKLQQGERADFDDSKVWGRRFKSQNNKPLADV